MTLQELYEALSDLLDAGVQPGNKIKIPLSSGSNEFIEAQAVSFAINMDTKERVIQIY